MEDAYLDSYWEDQYDSEAEYYQYQDADYGNDFWQDDLEDHMSPWEAEGEVFLAQFD